MHWFPRSNFFNIKNKLHWKRCKSNEYTDAQRVSDGRVMRWCSPCRCCLLLRLRLPLPSSSSSSSSSFFKIRISLRLLVGIRLFQVLTWSSICEIVINFTYPKRYRTQRWAACSWDSQGTCLSGDPLYLKDAGWCLSLNGSHVPSSTFYFVYWWAIVLFSNLTRLSMRQGFW